MAQSDRFEERTMSRSPVALRLPDDIYERVRRTAKGMRQSMETALVNIVKAATPSLEKVPVAYRPELEAMEDLGDQELWALTESQLTPARQRRLERLLDKNERGKLTERDQLALTDLRTDADRLMLQRSYAYLLLKYRGHRIPTLGDLTR
jgi:hypothetical protein